jgi:hypothetical protein
MFDLYFWKTGVARVPGIEYSIFKHAYSQLAEQIVSNSHKQSK